MISNALNGCGVLTVIFKITSEQRGTFFDSNVTVCAAPKE
jgi:hypothetical protein